MPTAPAPDADVAPGQWLPLSFGQRVTLILWPAFVMAGVLEMLLFAVVDPQTLTWFGGEPLEWSRNAIYSVTFLILWAVIAASGAITHLLEIKSRSDR